MPRSLVAIVVVLFTFVAPVDAQRVPPDVNEVRLLEDGETGVYPVVRDAWLLEAPLDEVVAYFHAAWSKAGVLRSNVATERRAREREAAGLPAVENFCAVVSSTPDAAVLTESQWGALASRLAGVIADGEPDAAIDAIHVANALQGDNLIGSDALAGAIGGVLRDRSTRVASQAALVIGRFEQLRTRETVRSLLALLDRAEGDDLLRTGQALSTGMLYFDDVHERLDGEVVRAVVNVLETRDLAFRDELWFIGALGRAHGAPEEAAAALASLLETEDVRRIGTVVISIDLGSPYMVTDETLRERGAAASLGLLLPLLEHETARVRMLAASAIRDHGPYAAAAVPVLVEHLEHEEDLVRSSVIMALGEIGEKAEPAVEALLRVTEENHPHAVSASEAIWKITRRGTAPTWADSWLEQREQTFPRTNF